MGRRGSGGAGEDKYERKFGALSLCFNLHQHSYLFCFCFCICVQCERGLGEEMLLVWGGAGSWGIEGTQVMEEQGTVAFH